MSTGLDRLYKFLAAGLLSLVIALLPLSLHAQDLRYLRHQSWSVEDGLPQSSVHRILQSRDGFLWIATEGGVARFDGVSFTVFRHETEPSFLSDDVCCIAEDAAGSLFFGTADGVVRLRGNHFDHLGEHEDLPAPAIIALATTADGSLFALTPAGLMHWHDDRFTPVAGAPANLVAIENTPTRGLLLLGEDSLATLHGTEIVPTPIPVPSSPTPFAGLAAGPHGELWLWSTDRLFFEFGSTRKTWLAGRDLPGTRIQSLTIDRNGAAWVGTNNGLSLLRADLPKATPVTALGGNAVLAVIEDREGNHWVGTDATGLHLLRPSKFRGEPALEDKPVTSVVEATDGSVWVGTREDGVRRARPDGTADEPAPARQLTSSVILSLAAGASGSVWVGTPDGLNHVDANGAVHRTTAADGLPDEFIRSLAADRDGSVWIGTRRGLAHLHGTRIDTLTRADGLGSDLIGALLQTMPSRNAGSPSAPPAGLWVGTSGGLSFLDGTGRIRTFGPADGLDGRIVTGMAQDRAGTLWLTTQGGGVSRYSGRGRFQSARVFSADDRIDGILVDLTDALWARSSRGVWRIPIVDLDRCLTSVATCTPPESPYGAADGLPSEDALPGGSPSMAQGAAGELWFATRRGLAAADPAHLAINRVPPPVALERFTIDDTAIPLDGSPITIPFGHGRFTFEYAGLSFTVPSKVRYRFRLDGFDHEWTNAGARRSATYTNLPPRSYRFHVEAMNNDGVWNDTGAELSFRVVPPFYRRWWFYLLVLLALSALVFALYRARLRRLRQQFDAVLAERNRIAREIHDTLAQDFVGVSIQLEIVSRMLTASKVQAAVTQLDQTRRLVRDGIAEARQSIWELRANTAAASASGDPQESLPTRITRLANRFSSGARSVRIEVTGPYRALEPGVESEILRIAQESLTNADKHAEATEVTVTITYASDTLELRIGDNGRGFSVESAPSLDGHYGLRGMNERAANLHAALAVHSEPGRGVEVTLLVPIAALER